MSWMLIAYQPLLHADPMARALRSLRHEHGGGVFYRAMLEQFEYRPQAGADAANLEGEAWWGSDENKAWIKLDSDFRTDDFSVAEADIELLYSRAIAPFWDLQAGLGQIVKSDPSRTQFIIGAKGLAPYWFEIDSALYINHKGNVSLSIEAEYDVRITQRLIAQPKIEFDLGFTNEHSRALADGIRTIEIGLRFRYEFTARFAPYIGFTYETLVGDTADLNSGEDDAELTAVLGLRLWY